MIILPLKRAGCWSGVILITVQQVCTASFCTTSECVKGAFYILSGRLHPRSGIVSWKIGMPVEYQIRREDRGVHWFHSFPQSIALEDFGSLMIDVDDDVSTGSAESHAGLPLHSVLPRAVGLRLDCMGPGNKASASHCHCKSSVINCVASAYGLWRHQITNLI